MAIMKESYLALQYYMKIFTWYYTYWTKTGYCVVIDAKSYTSHRVSHLIPKDGLYLDNPCDTNAFF